MPINHQILLAARPTGFPKDSDFQLIEMLQGANIGKQLVRVGQE